MNVSETVESEGDGSDALRPASNSAEVDLWERVRLSVARLDNASRRQREPEFIAHKMAERAKAYRQPLQPDRRGDSLVFLSFSTAQQRYAVAIDEVLEIEPLEHFCAVPQVPAFIRGVIQWRGTILTLVDLGELFSIPQTGIADLRASLIIEAAGKRIAVAAGEIEEILTIPADQIMVPPDLSGSLPAAWLAGVYDNNRMLVRMGEILNDERITRWRVAGK